MGTVAVIQDGLEIVMGYGSAVFKVGAQAGTISDSYLG